MKEHKAKFMKGVIKFGENGRQVTSGSLRSPEIFAPAMIPVAAGK